MEECQVAHDLADHYFNCHMKDIFSFTHNVSTEEFNCFLYYNNNCQVHLSGEINLLSKRPDDFELSKEGWSKFFVITYKVREQELYSNISCFTSFRINRNNGN